MLIPFKYVDTRNKEGITSVTRIAYYQEDRQRVVHNCKKCLDLTGRVSRFCKACSEEFKAGDEVSYLKRLEANTPVVNSVDTPKESVL